MIGLREPVEIAFYVEYDNGKVIIDDNIPVDLKPIAEKYAQEYEERYKKLYPPDSLTEY